MTAEHTREGPARYLPAFGPREVCELETGTIQRPDRLRGRTPAKTEYLRDTGAVIGWDEGEATAISFVECSGGASVRAFHGRPIRPGSPKLGPSWREP